MPREDYYERQERRAERLEARADKARAEQGRLFDYVDTVAGIMNGTPLLIGHHSEKRHRRELERMDNAMRNGVQLGRYAERCDSRAEAIAKAAALIQRHEHRFTQPDAQYHISCFNAHEATLARQMIEWANEQAHGVCQLSLF